LVTFLLCAVSDISELRLHIMYAGARYPRLRLLLENKRRKIEGWRYAGVPVNVMALDHIPRVQAQSFSDPCIPLVDVP
jgi:hypothetical protein